MNDAPGIYCATVLSRQNILLESGVSFVGGESVANHEEDDEVLETLEETEEGNSTASHPNYDYNTNYGPKFTLIDKLGTLTLPRRLIDDMDGEVDNYEEYDRHSEKELKVDSSLGQENLFCIKNQILSNDTYGEPILSIRMPQKKSNHLSLPISAYQSDAFHKGLASERWEMMKIGTFIGQISQLPLSGWSL